MKSTTGEHYVALDHLRALAAFLVFTWHFTHATNGFPVPFEFVPAIPPFALLDEGQTGVALFMTLSGYLFAKLLDGKRIIYSAFIWNRALRLLPLLAFVILVDAYRKIHAGESLLGYAYWTIRGVLLPALPNGGWSITVEFHFYLLLPLLLWMLRKSALLPLGVVAAAITLRWYLHLINGEVQGLGYWTIVGRIDQFVLGIVAFHARARICARPGVVVAVLLAFVGLYWYFDFLGGFYKYGAYPSPSRLWIVLPTLEAVAYSTLIAWYDTTFRSTSSVISKVIGRVGEYSYSIYLLHFFFVFAAAKYIHENIMDLSNFYVACVWAFAMFLLMVPIAYLSFRFIEAPFLRYRKRYATSVKC